MYKLQITKISYQKNTYTKSNFSDVKLVKVLSVSPKHLKSSANISFELLKFKFYFRLSQFFEIFRLNLHTKNILTLNLNGAMSNFLDS